MRKVNEATNVPEGTLKQLKAELKEKLSTIEKRKLERESKKEGVPVSVQKEVGSKVVGPIESIRKKLREEVDTARPTDDIKANKKLKNKLESLLKEAEKIEGHALRLDKKIAKSITDAKAKAPSKKNEDFKALTRRYLNLSEDNNKKKLTKKDSAKGSTKKTKKSEPEKKKLTKKGSTEGSTKRSRKKDKDKEKHDLAAFESKKTEKKKKNKNSDC